jgi:hypothetical protein
VYHSKAECAFARTIPSAVSPLNSSGQYVRIRLMLKMLSLQRVNPLIMGYGVCIVPWRIILNGLHQIALLRT